MGEYEYQGDSTGMDNKDLKERPFPEYLLKKELSEANEKMQEIINAIPGALPSIRYPIFLKPSISRMVCRNCPAIRWRNTGSS